MLQSTRNNSLPIPNPLLAKTLDIPLLLMHSSQQHGSNLIEEKAPCRHTPLPPNHPEPTPLNRFNKVMWVEHEANQPILCIHVYLCNGFIPWVFPSLMLSLAWLRVAARRMSRHDRVRRGSQHQRWPCRFQPTKRSPPSPWRIWREPAADAGRIENWECKRGEGYKRMYGVHGKIEKRPDCGSVEIMGCLWRGK